MPYFKRICDTTMFGRKYLNRKCSSLFRGSVDEMKHDLSRSCNSEVRAVATTKQTVDWPTNCAFFFLHPQATIKCVKRLRSTVRAHDCIPSTPGYQMQLSTLRWRAIARYFDVKQPRTNSERWMQSCFPPSSPSRRFSFTSAYRFPSYFDQPRSRCFFH